MRRLHTSSKLLSVLLGIALLLSGCGGGGGGGGHHGGGGGGGGGNQVIDLNIGTTQKGPNFTFTDGTNMSLGVVVSNIGALPSDQLVTVTVTLPSGVQYASYTSTTPGWTCTANSSGQTVSCTSSASIAGLTGTSTVTLNVSVASNAGGPATLTLTVSTPDGTPTSNSISMGVIFNTPVPTVTSLSPSSAFAGGAAFTLTVNGTNFVASSEVQWNGGNCPTTFVSGTQLSSSISADDIQTAGTESVTVVNPAPAGGTSNAIAFTVNPAPALTITQPPFSPVLVATGASVTPFIASVANGAPAIGVVWAVNGIVGGNSTLGTISPAQATSGQPVTYTAPGSVPTPSSVSITASSATNSSIVSPPLSVDIVPNYNALLNGQFAFQLRGFQPKALPFAEVGSFAADGEGGLSNVVIDIGFSNGGGGSGAVGGDPWSGWYTMDSATHGTLQLTENANPSVFMSLSIELDQGGQQGFLIETEGNIPGPDNPSGSVGSGSFMMQSPAAFDLGPGHFQGTYLMRLDGVNNSGQARSAIIGLFTVAPNSSTDITDGTITSGEADDSSGNHSQLTGAVTIDDPSVGLGSANFTVTSASGSQTLAVVFCIVDAGHVFVLTVDTPAPDVLTGIFRFQKTSSGYSTSNALNGPSLFEALGINSSGHASLIGGTLSVDSANPTTNIAGIYDSNDGGVIPGTAPVTYAGTYTVTSEGRGTLNLTSDGVTVFNAVFYLRNPGDGLVIEQPVNGSTEGRTGQITPQTVPSGGFEDSTFGNITDVDSTETVTSGSANGLGVVTLNGSASPATFSAMGDGSLLGTAPVFGATSSGEFSITDSARGRGTLTIASGLFFGSVNPIFYAIDSATIAVIPQDAAVVDPQLILIRP